MLGAAILASPSARADAGTDAAKTQSDFIAAHGDSPVAGVRIEGLHKTRPGVVNQWLTCTAGRPLSTCDLRQIVERLYRLAIFSTVDVSLEEDRGGVEIAFRFEEKWTLYPVPMLWYSPGTQLAGLVLVEANLLGYNKGLAVGGAYSNRGWYTLAGYNDPNIAYTNLWGSVHAFFGSGLVENDAPGGSIEQSFDMTRLDLEYALGWTLWDRVSPAWTGALRAADIGDVHVRGDDPPVDATVAIQGFHIIYSDKRYRDLYDEGLRLSAEVQHAFPLRRGTLAYDDTILDAKWAHPAPFGGSFDVRAHAFLGALPVAFEERLGGLDGSRTLPGGGLVAADRYASLSLLYQIPFLTYGPGTAAGVVFGEAGRYARNREAAVNYGGPGVGLRLYLKRVAIPAVGVDVGYEVGTERFNFSVVVGYRPVR